MAPPDVTLGMSSKALLPCLLFLTLTAPGLYAQEPDIKEPIRADTAVRIYKEIERVAQRTWLSNVLYDLFFKPIAFTGEKEGYRYRKLLHQPYSGFEGMPVRHIRIVTLNPFGYDVYDTTEVPVLGTERFGNALHARTLRRTVGNLLLFNEGEPFDSLLVKESERLIRQELYIQEVFFYPEISGGGRDSVDLLIRVHDSWSLIPALGISARRFSTGFTENNLAGLNHVLRTFYTWNHAIGRHAMEADYTVRNIMNTYISTSASYRLHEAGDHRAGFAVDRPFFSPVTRWAGGFSAYYEQRTDTLRFSDGQVRFLQSTSIPQDYWAAGSWQLGSGSTADDRATSLIASARISAINYLMIPGPPFDVLDIYRDRALFLTGIGLSTRKYVRDRYIFNYGFIEDVPTGRAYGLVGGYEMRTDPRWYVGAHYRWGQYYRWGYFGLGLEYGNFFRSGTYEQGMARAGIIYFTGALELGRWKFRQFVKPELTIGISRLTADAVTLNESQRGIRGFNSAELFGTHRFMLTLQSQSYAPWRLLGFQFGPYFTMSMGMLGDAENGFSQSSPYWMFGLGFLINNRYLVFENFEVSLAFYPHIPGTGENNGRNIIIGNAFRTTDFGFPDYGLGRPDVVGY